MSRTINNCTVKDARKIPSLYHSFIQGKGENNILSTRRGPHNDSSIHSKFRDPTALYGTIQTIWGTVFILAK